MENMFKASGTTTQFTEPQKSKGILDDYKETKVLYATEIIYKGEEISIKLADHPHQDVNTTASPTFVTLNCTTVDLGTNTIVDADVGNWNDHIADNSQAHSDYLLNNASDSSSGTITAAGFTTAGATSTSTLDVSSTSQFDGDVNVGDGSAIGKLKMSGIGGIPPSRRGGEIQWGSAGTTATGFTFTNSLNQFVWSDATQAGFQDKGKAYIDMNDGLGSFAGGNIIYKDGGVIECNGLQVADNELIQIGLPGSTNEGNIYTDGDHLIIQAVDSMRLGTGTTNYTQVAADGEITLHGTARVKMDMWLGTDGFRTPGTKPASQVDYGIADAWEFTDGTDDTLYARFKLPNNMDKSVAPTISIGWSTPTANAGNCRWQIEYLYRQVDEDMTAAADATLVDNFAASNTADGLTLSTVGTLAVPNANDVCVTMRIKRRADEAADTLGEDNYLLGLCMEYTSNKLGTAT
jgi:hypothetical protein